MNVLSEHLLQQQGNISQTAIYPVNRNKIYDLYLAKS